MKHYTIEELDQYRYKDGIGWLPRLICCVHLHYCPVCQSRLSQLEDDDRLLQKLRESIKKLRIEPNSVAYRELCATFHEEIRSRSSI